MKKYNLAASVLLSLVSSAALAGGASPFYLGGTIGQANVDNNNTQLDNHGYCENADKHGQVCNIGDGGEAYHIYGGFQISESIAVEAGYADLGNTASYYYDDPVSTNQDTKGISVAGVYRHRLGKTSPVQVYGKAGAFAWQSKATTSVSTLDDIPVGTVKDNGVSPMIGAGLEYDVTQNVSLRAGWDRYYSVGKGDRLVENSKLQTLDTDVDVYSAGVNFSFY